ncbi:hypothetical protein [Cesiribacter sp. SM1]|uniref:hypothetical protein n=1 Tax=Cesiribacter sp. SM1 TaxID=2861196 RepID=UPI001CD2BE25|nr:hypothetical protein [Cesiribacter sp. SM1]
MEKISSIQVHFKTAKTIELNRLSAFIERVQAELMSGATFTGSLQTQDYLYSNIADILDFEGLYSEHAVQNWHITFNKGSLRVSVHFQDYQNEPGVGVATFNHDIERNKKFRNMVLEVLDTELR